MEPIYKPEAIAALPHDHRGYPIPFIVLRDINDKPVFVSNDALLVTQAVRDNLCHICGQPLDVYSWFVGGPGSALLNGNQAVYNDGPLHHECMQYAMQVCPYLACRLTKELAPATSERLRAQGLRVSNTATMPGTPAVFMAVCAYSYKAERRGMTMTFFVDKPFRKVEYWRETKMLPRDEGEKLAKRAARRLAATGGLR